jgi:large conductance mechanosensitive channel
MAEKVESPPRADEHHLVRHVHPPLVLPQVLRGPLQGFLDFIRQQGVVGLAVGLVLGVAAKSVVDSVVNNIFNPLIGVLTGGVDLSNKYWCLNHANGQCINRLGYGQLLSDIISFLIVAVIIYFVVTSLKLDKFDKPKAE